MSAIKFKSYLANKKIKQSWLAKKLGITPQAISKWATGDGKPSLEMIKRLSSVLVEPIDTVVGWFLPRAE